MSWVVRSIPPFAHFALDLIISGGFVVCCVAGSRVGPCRGVCVFRQSFLTSLAAVLGHNEICDTICRCLRKAPWPDLQPLEYCTFCNLVVMRPITDKILKWL